jgi:hypothetical protein
MDFTDDRIRAMLRGRREVRVYPLPGADDEAEFAVGIRVLTGEEIDDARTEATQYTQALAKRRKLDVQQLQWIDGDPHEAEVHRQIIYRACIDPDSVSSDAEPKPFFPGVQAVRQIDDTFAQMLYQLYLSHQQWVNPYLGASQSEVTEIIEALKKTPERRAMLGLYDVPTLLTLAASMAAQLADSPTGK